MLFIRIDKLCFLSFKHGVDFILEIESEVIESFDKLFNLFDIILDRKEGTEYL